MSRAAAARCVVQFVQHLAHPPVELAAWPDGAAPSRLVFITRNISERQVRDLMGAVRALASGFIVAGPPGLALVPFRSAPFSSFALRSPFGTFLPLGRLTMFCRAPPGKACSDRSGVPRARGTGNECGISSARGRYPDLPGW